MDPVFDDLIDLDPDEMATVIEHLPSTIRKIDFSGTSLRGLIAINETGNSLTLNKCKSFPFSTIRSVKLDCAFLYKC